jgi:hypothetical protein
MLNSTPWDSLEFSVWSYSQSDLLFVSQINVSISAQIQTFLSSFKGTSVGNTELMLFRYFQPVGISREIQSTEIENSTDNRALVNQATICNHGFYSFHSSFSTVSLL